MTCYNLDARAFVRRLLRDGVEFEHVILNLPALSLEFLDVFGGDACAGWARPPRVHCYCFSGAGDAAARRADVIARAEKAMGKSLAGRDVETRDVRDVAPNKQMVCVSFEVPAQPGAGRRGAPAKRAKA